MWTKTLTKTYQGLSKNAVWAAWADVANWTQWHDDVEKMEMDGPFTAGTTMTMHLKGGPSPKIKLTEVRLERNFTDVTKFPGALMTDYHLLEETPEGLKITNVITVNGFLSWLWVKLVANDVAETGIKHMDQLEQYLKKNNG